MNNSLSRYLKLLNLFFTVFFVSNTVFAEEDLVLNIYTVNYPLKFFAESIAGEHATVKLPMPADIDPAFWTPKAEQVLDLQSADLILINGANYAKWLPTVSLPIFKLINTSSEFKDAYIDIKSAVKHKHGSGDEHSHIGTAFTTWLDFNLASQQAKAIFKALSNKKPRLNSKFVKNFITLEQSLSDLDVELTKIGASLEGKALLGSHPVYQYLKKRYQLNLKSVHWEPEETPSESQWEDLKQLLQTHPAQWMLWEAEPATATVRKLESMGIKSIVFNPCANIPHSGDFLTVMRENIKALKTTLN